MTMKLESHLPPEKSARITIAVVIFAGTVFLCLPRMTGWTLEHVHKEDGLIFLTDFLRDGWGSLLHTYTGYLHVGPRLVTGVCAGGLPAEMFAGCIGISTAIFRGILAFVALAVFLPYATSWKWALAAASVILFHGVGQHEVLGNITNMRWFTDLAALLVLLGNFRKPGSAAAIALLAIVAALSDPLALLLVPLAIWKLVRLSGWGRLVPAVYSGAGLVHYLLMNSEARVADWAFLLHRPADFFAQALVRGPIEALIGQNGAQVAINQVGPYVVLLGLLLPVAVVAASWRKAASPILTLTATMALVGMAILCATLLFAPLEIIALSNEGSLGQASRYALLPATLIAQALLLLVPTAINVGKAGRIAGMGVVGLMATAAVADAPGDRWNVHGPRWTETVQQAGQDCKASRSASITVPVTPQGVPMKWTATLSCSWVQRTSNGVASQIFSISTPIRPLGNRL